MTEVLDVPPASPEPSTHLFLLHQNLLTTKTIATSTRNTTAAMTPCDHGWSLPLAAGKNKDRSDMKCVRVLCLLS